MEVPTSQTTTNTVSIDLAIGPGNESLNHVLPNKLGGRYNELASTNLTIGEPSQLITTPTTTPYGKCNKNHALNNNNTTSTLHVVDGCGEFMQSTSTNPSDPDFLNCVACGCHRSFHHDITYQSSVHRVIEYQFPAPARPQTSTTPNNSPSPPHPISSAYFPAPTSQMLNAFNNPSLPTIQTNPPNATKKRYRSKFSQDQKTKMKEFAEKVGWKMYKKDEEIINEFCNEIGVTRCVFKVWMHNHKNTNKSNNIGEGNNHQE
uniref:zinc-finger homeodomain protein 9-like n=1 Tax=Erigeron canadensis TaxID=72917 RepID=UPI001CB9356C|nr:zinc-finger homeodomain protein 9-like [Erigeron canadensis]